MLKIDGKEYRTVADAAECFRVSVKSIRSWINKGIIPPPPKIEYGLRDVEIFPDEYLEEARCAVIAYREKRKARQEIA